MAQQVKGGEKSFKHQRWRLRCREGRYDSKPFQCDDETFQGVQRL